MNQSQAIGVLNELLVIHFRSFAQYLSVVHPWIQQGDEEVVEAIRDIVEDQQKHCTRLADMIQRRGGRIDQGDFPMDFTDTHDLGLDFIIKKLTFEQERDVTRVASCVDRLDEDVPAKVLAEEALGAARAHLDSLLELDTVTIAVV